MALALCYGTISKSYLLTIPTPYYRGRLLTPWTDCRNAFNKEHDTELGLNDLGCANLIRIILRLGGYVARTISIGFWPQCYQITLNY